MIGQKAADCFAKHPKDRTLTPPPIFPRAVPLSGRLARGDGARVCITNAMHLLFDKQDENVKT